MAFREIFGVCKGGKGILLDAVTILLLREISRRCEEDGSRKEKGTKGEITRKH